MCNFFLKTRYYVLIVSFSILIDQITKYYFESQLNLYETISIIPNILSWTLAYNTGAAFSFLAEGSGWQRWFFTSVAIVVSCILVVWIKKIKQENTLLALALCLVLSGAIGNLIDRVIYGHVIDFILVHWQDKWFFPVFNIADSLITIGAFLLIVDMFLEKKHKKSSIKSNK